MKKQVLTCIVFLLAFALFAEAPVVSNVSVAQRTDGSKLVDITYDVTDSDSSQLWIELKVSDDSGLTFEIEPTQANLSGDFGSNVTPGNNKTIIWDIGIEDGIFDGDNFQLKVLAYDQEPTPPVPQAFVLVEGGTFNNGTADVTLSDFYMCKYEVTQGEYEAVIGSNPAHDYGVGNNYPVYYVTWYNAVEYCNARSLQEGLTPCYDTSDWSCDFTANGYRLPTEMEWMYAAKGGNQEPASGYNQYAGTDVESELTNYAWYSSNAGNQTHAVGTKLPNQLGLYDMSGNVYEWCNDWYGSYSSSSQTNPTGPSSGSYRILRGGSWGNSASGCCVASRYSINPTYSSYNLGFRIIRAN